MVTHEPDIAAHACRVIRLGDGRVIEDSATAPCKTELQ
jgi:ABC-type lipoprotein export system ATPase subunit